MEIYKNNKEIFSEIRDKLFEQAKDVKISSLKNINVLETIKTLKVIELDNFESFSSYTNYDHYLIFKFNEDYFFCDTELASLLNTSSMIRMTDFNQLFRREKLNKINENSIS